MHINTYTHTEHDGSQLYDYGERLPNHEITQHPLAAGAGAEPGPPSPAAAAGRGDVD